MPYQPRFGVAGRGSTTFHLSWDDMPVAKCHSKLLLLVTVPLSSIEKSPVPWRFCKRCQKYDTHDPDIEVYFDRASISIG